MKTSIPKAVVMIQVDKTHEVQSEWQLSTVMAPLLLLTGVVRIWGVPRWRGRTSHHSRVLSGREQEHVSLLGLHTSNESQPLLFHDELGDRGIPVPVGFWEYR